VPRQAGVEPGGDLVELTQCPVNRNARRTDAQAAGTRPAHYFAARRRHPRGGAPHRPCAAVTTRRPIHRHPTPHRRLRNLPGTRLRHRPRRTLISGAAVAFLGWAGAAALLLAYALITRDPTTATGHRYLVMNLAGSAGLAANGGRPRRLALHGPKPALAHPGPERPPATPRHAPRRHQHRAPSQLTIVRGPGLWVRAAEHARLRESVGQASRRAKWLSGAQFRVDGEIIPRPLVFPGPGRQPPDHLGGSAKVDSEGLPWKWEQVLQIAPNMLRGHPLTPSNAQDRLAGMKPQPDRVLHNLRHPIRTHMRLHRKIIFRWCTNP